LGRYGIHRPTVAWLILMPKQLKFQRGAAATLLTAPNLAGEIRYSYEGEYLPPVKNVRRIRLRDIVEPCHVERTLRARQTD
jgi:hypothetical protein